mmetsp:Transcript_75554/g.149335  ORF Transcript_75554/g.149335 Transcript_75554/m.149335 type:complete len:99 (+) Transcript_75554:338-634(+)
MSFATSSIWCCAPCRYTSSRAIGGTRRLPSRKLPTKGGQAQTMNYTVIDARLLLLDVMQMLVQNLSAAAATATQEDDNELVNADGTGQGSATATSILL